MSKMLFFDIETHSADKRHDMEPREFFRLGQYAWDDGPVVLTEDYDEFMAVVDAAPYVVGHNIFAFDLPALYGNESLRPLQRGQFRRAVDTMILAHLLTPAPYSYTSRKGHTYFDAAAPNNAMRYYSLDNLAFQFNLPGKMGDLKELAKKHNPPKTLVRDLDFGLIPTDDPEFREYAEGDIVAVRALYKHLMWVLSTSDYDRDYIWREMEIAAVNARITSNGIYIDTAAARATVDEQARSREEILTWLVNDFDFPTEGKQPWKSDAGKEAIQRILAAYGIVFGEHPEWTATEKGAPSFAGDTLIAITAGTDAEHIGIALAELQGQRSMAQLALESTHADGKAHPDITMFQRSGRFSYLRPGLTVWDTPNKHVFLADPGHVAVELDFSNADARAVAALSGDREYAKRFDTDEDGNDLYDGHNLNGEALFGKGDYYAPGYDDHGRPTLRPLAKMIGHALNYNAGAKKLTSEANKACKTLGIDREFETGDLYDMINNFESTFPRLAAWKNRVVREGESGAVVNAWGRRMVIDKVWDKARGEHRSRSYTQAPALHGQSTTREVMSDALIKLARLGGDWPYRIKGVIHDALWVCLPKETVDTDIRQVVECMETVFHPKGGIPIPFPVGVGPTGAENFRDASH